MINNLLINYLCYRYDLASRKGTKTGFKSRLDFIYKLRGIKM